jgi:hypothetical protein
MEQDGFLALDVRRMLQWLSHQDHGVIEIRLIHPTRGYVGVGFFDDADACLKCVEAVNGQANIYVGLQPRHRRFLDLAPNRIERLTRTATDADIEILTNVAFDIDAVRPKDQASTEDELGHVRETAHQVMSHLEAAGIKAPLEIMTGNGTQLLYAIPPVASRMPALESALASIKTWEGRIIVAFSSPQARIDKIANPSRIVRLAGTLNIKGANTPDRPWRVSRILQCPSCRIENPCLLEAKPEATRSKPSERPAPAAGEARASLPACTAVKRLWTNGYNKDRSKAIWGMALCLRALNVPDSQAVLILYDLDARTGRKLTNRRDAEQYLHCTYAKTMPGKAAPPCLWLCSIGLCSVDVVCDYGKNEICVPCVTADGAGGERGKGILSQGEARMSWKPKETMREINMQPGDYRARITEAYDTRSKSSNAEMTTVAFEIIDKGANEGQVIWDHFRKDHPVAKRRMMELLGVLGLLDSEMVENSDLVGKEMVIRIDIEERDGRQTERIRRFLKQSEA